MHYFPKQLFCIYIFIYFSAEKEKNGKTISPSECGSNELEIRWIHIIDTDIEPLDNVYLSFFFFF